jgi:acetyltransferase
MIDIFETWSIYYPFLLQTPGSLLRQSRKGRQYNIRRMKQSDSPLLTEFMRSLSSPTLWMRFFVPYPALSDEAISREIARLNQILAANGQVLVVTTYNGEKEEIIGIGEMIPNKELPATAELAVLIGDAYQGEGIGSATMLQLVEEAARKGVTTLQAEAMAQNRAMLRLWTKLGLPYSFHTRQSMTNMLAQLG